MRNPKFIAGAIALTWGAIVWSETGLAAHPVLGGGSGKGAGPIVSPAAGNLGPGQWGITFQVDRTEFDAYSTRELLRFAQRDREVHAQDSTTYYTLSVSYGIRSSVTAHLSVPYVVRQGIRESEPPDEVHDHGDSRGLGDAAGHVHVRLARWDTMGLELTGILAIKVPTGQTHVEDRNGEDFDAEFQPGSGAWDTTVGLALSERYGPFGFHGSARYTWVTEGTQHTDLGDRFNYDLALVYRVAPPVRADLALELNGLWQGRERTHGKKDPDSGGHVLLLSPGVRFRFHPRANVYVSAGIPLLQDLNGDQNEVRFRVLAGVGVAL